MELRPLDDSHAELLRSLQEQEDVWEFVGALLLPREEGQTHHLFAILEDRVPLGIGGLVTSQGLGEDDFELLCVLRSEAQRRGFAKRACDLLLGWAFGTAKLERVIACIDDANEGARSIATKLGMKEAKVMPAGRTVYVKYRDERA
jgi:RimJ/RimL family protein N-acetyltransferase